MIINNLGLILICVIIAVIASIISTNITFNYLIEKHFDTITKFSLDILESTKSTFIDLFNQISKRL